MTRALTWIGLVVFLLLILVPFWWIASMSFKTYEQIQFAVSIYVPKPFTWENYTGLWTETRFPLWLRNSLVTALVVTLITSVVASLGGYAVARLRFPGREAVASLILILYLIPPALLFIPLYRVLTELGATNHLSALFLSYPTFTVPFCTWLLIGFFKALPEELEEARSSTAPDGSPPSSACCSRSPRRDSSPRPSSRSRSRGTNSSMPWYSFRMRRGSRCRWD
jgi:multiple sugar transport system permease protein